MRDRKLLGRLVLALTVSVYGACASSSGSAPQNGSGGVAAATSGGGGGPATAGGTAGGAAGSSAAGAGSGAAGMAAAGGGGTTIPPASGGVGGGAVSSGGSPGTAGETGGAGAGGTPASADSGAGGAGQPGTGTGGKVLIYTNSTGFRHVSIEPEAEALRLALTAQGFSPEVSADPARFSTAGLAGLRGIVLVSTTGKSLGDPGTEAIAALDAFVQGGGALIGFHAASSTFYDPGTAYTRLIGGKFVNHPGSVRQATCFPEGTHPSSAKLPPSFQTKDEIYVMDHTRNDNQVVLRCAALTGPEKLPIAWYRSEGKGRVFYSALGHNAEDFAPTSFLMRDHFLAGALWALGR